MMWNKTIFYYVFSLNINIRVDGWNERFTFHCIWPAPKINDNVYGLLGDTDQNYNMYFLCPFRGNAVAITIWETWDEWKETLIFLSAKMDYHNNLCWLALSQDLLFPVAENQHRFYLFLSDFVIVVHLVFFYTTFHSIFFPLVCLLHQN